MHVHIVKIRFSFFLRLSYLRNYDRIIPSRLVSQSQFFIPYLVSTVIWVTIAILNSNFREKLQLEIAARERAEKKQQEYEDRLRQMQEEMERSQANLLEAQDMIRRLEEQLRQLQAAKEELEQRQNELQAMMQRLEESKVNIYANVRIHVHLISEVP